jgi:hypothetical protein
MSRRSLPQEFTAIGRVPVVGMDAREDAAEVAVVEVELVAGASPDAKVEVDKSGRATLLH